MIFECIAHRRLQFQDHRQGVPDNHLSPFTNHNFQGQLACLMGSDLLLSQRHFKGAMNNDRTVPMGL